MPTRCRASSEWLTARLSSIGNSGGTTEVTIMQQCSRSFHRHRLSSCGPWSGLGVGVGSRPVARGQARNAACEKGWSRGEKGRDH
eukprot:scaffold5705_cov53-Phaeocystis_antarctica.AAC.3